MTEDLLAKIPEMNRRLEFLWGDFYGDDLRQERGMKRDLRMLTLALNRLSVVLVFFAVISLLNLFALVWVVLSL